MEITASLVKELREKTGVGMMQCKKALAEANGDVSAAEKLLRKAGVAAAAKKASRATGEGQVASYIHTGGKIGVLVEVNCETDFVAKNDDFKDMAKNIAMHIAATNPVGITPEDVPEDIIEREKGIYRAQALETGKPENILDKIAEGKLLKYFKENCLLQQPYVRDPDMTVEDLLNENIGKIGENITIRRFCRFQIGES